MKIDSSSPVGKTTNIKKLKKNTDSVSAFDVGNVESSNSVESVASVNAPNALLLLQNIESSDPNIVRKKGEQLLGYLEDLQKDLLSNQVSKATLELMLDSIKNQQEKCEDSQLMETLSLIEQRASIELAKLKYI